MTIVRALTAAVLAASAVAGGCLGGGSRADIATVSTAGVIVTVGGPASGAPAPIPGVELRLVGAGGSVSVRADRGGRFNADLAPGIYQVTITGHADSERTADAADARRDARRARCRAPGAAGRLGQVAATA
jgi:hypothetical protein